VNWHWTKHEKYTDIILDLMSSKIVVHRTLVSYTRWAYIINTWVIWRHSMRPYSLPRLWRYINLILTYLLTERWNMSNSAEDISTSGCGVWVQDGVGDCCVGLWMVDNECFWRWTEVIFCQGQKLFWNCSIITTIMTVFEVISSFSFEVLQPKLVI